MIKKINLLLLFFCIANSAIGQQNTNVEISMGKQIRNIVRENIVVENIRDSTAIYFFTIKINLKPKSVNSEYLATIEINNKSVADFFGGLDKLKQLDYSTILKNRKEIDIFIKSEILVYGSKDNNTIKLNHMEDALKYMYANRSGPFYELFGIRLVIDKKVYD
ncbi:MAG: hypothetical protein EOO42_17425 [Flavobacteriales bacterium]|nr:MAG: hypothetical protein EOO42_17425 [Flavobacteriales bacterium]